MTIAQIRANKVLNQIANYSGLGTMTRKQFIDNAILLGNKIEQVNQRNHAAEDKEREYLSKNAFSHPWGNTSHPQTIAYNNRKEALKAGIFKTTYRAYVSETSFFNITKTEYDYYISQKLTDSKPLAELTALQEKAVNACADYIINVTNRQGRLLPLEMLYTGYLATHNENTMSSEGFAVVYVEVSKHLELSQG